VLQHTVTLDDGTVVRVPLPPVMEEPEVDKEDGTVDQGGRDGPTRRVPLGTIVDARSGDKGSDANVGLWVRTDEAYAWLRSELTVARFRELLPEAEKMRVTRTLLPNLRAVNFVVQGLLEGGAAATRRFDRQAKALGEFLRSRHVEVPVGLLPGG
jgi:hypothetical protein